MLTKFDLLSINQTSPQIKLTEARKARRDKNYPIKMKYSRETPGDEIARQVRMTTQKKI